MATPVQYQHQLSEMNLDVLSKPVREEAKSEVEELQNQLHQMEQDVNREIHVIRFQYQHRIDAANQGGTSRVLFSGKQAGSGRHRAEEVSRLEADLDSKLAPYQEVKTKITELLEKIEAAMTAGGG